jgi:hypothetical protein
LIRRLAGGRGWKAERKGGIKKNNPFNFRYQLYEVEGITGSGKFVDSEALVDYIAEVERRKNIFIKRCVSGLCEQYASHRTIAKGCELHQEYRGKYYLTVGA